MHPVIENSTILNLLKQHNIKVLANLTDIRVSTNNTLYQHIKTARKITYISPDNDIEIPAFLDIEADGEINRGI